MMSILLPVPDNAPSSSGTVNDDSRNRLGAPALTRSGFLVLLLVAGQSDRQAQRGDGCHWRFLSVAGANENVPVRVTSVKLATRTDY